MSSDPNPGLFSLRCHVDIAWFNLWLPPPSMGQMGVPTMFEHPTWPIPGWDCHNLGLKIVVIIFEPPLYHIYTKRTLPLTLRSTLHGLNV